MKALLINGSPRREGNTFLALSEVAKTLRECGVELPEKEEFIRTNFIR